MEKEEKKMQNPNDANINEQSAQESQRKKAVSKDKEKQPKTMRCLKCIFILVVLAVVAAAAFLIYTLYQNKENEEYVYEYGMEPNDGPVVYSKNKSNIINPTTKEVIVEDIDWCHYSSNKDEDPIVLFAQKGKRGFCNIVTNEIIVPATTYTKAWEFSEGLAAVEKNGYIGFVNTKGDVAIKFKYSYRGNPLTEFVFHNGHCVVADSSNRIGVIDHKGRWVIEPRYDRVQLTKEYAIVYKDGNFKKQIDFEGNVLQDGIIDYINEIYYEENYKDLNTGQPDVGQVKNNDFYEYRVGNYSGLINSKGEIITPPIYTDISGISPTLFKAQLKDWTSMVIIDQKGNVISTVAK